MSALGKIDFQNLILEKDIERARFRRGKSNDNTLVPPGPDVVHDLERLYEESLKIYERNKAEPDFSLNFDKIRFRVSIITEGVFVYRRMLDYVPGLQKCGIHPRMRELMLKIKSGMVLFMGEFSSGKTTAASSFFVEHITQNGGLGIGLEDPSELPMAGDRGRGRIYQLSLSRTEIDQKAHDLVRANYDALYYSELRGALMTYSAILSAEGGRLLVSTVHGPTIPQGLSRTVNLTSSLNTGGDIGAESVRRMFANSLKVVVFMKEFDAGGYGPSDYLIVDNDARAIIAKGDYAGLLNSIDLTNKRLLSGQPLPNFAD